MIGVDPTEGYLSGSCGGGYTYHTHLDYPNLPTVYKTLLRRTPNSTTQSVETNVNGAATTPSTTKTETTNSGIIGYST